MERSEMHEAVERVKRMEIVFDMLQAALHTDQGMIVKDSGLRASLSELIQYYESGQWLHDYELDEQGVFPVDLKRGVLSQDAVFDLLSAVSKL